MIKTEIAECAESIYEFLRPNYPDTRFGQEVSLTDAVMKIKGKVGVNGLMGEVKRVEGLMTLYSGSREDVENYVLQNRLGSDCATWRSGLGERIFKAVSILEGFAGCFDSEHPHFRRRHPFFEYSDQGLIGWKNEFYDQLMGSAVESLAEADRIRERILFDDFEVFNEDDARVWYMMEEFDRKNDVVALLKEFRIAYKGLAGIGDKIIKIHEKNDVLF